jgi:hypothetical protein
MTDHEIRRKLKKRTVFGPHSKSKFIGEDTSFVKSQIAILSKPGAAFQ